MIGSVSPETVVSNKEKQHLTSISCFQETRDDDIYTEPHYSGEKEVVQIIRRCSTYEQWVDTLRADVRIIIGFRVIH